MSSTSPLFRRYIDGFTIGELPKVVEQHESAGVTVEVSPERWRELGYVQVEDGGWVPLSDAFYLPKNGTMRWVRR